MYAGEPVTQLQHALQSGHLAEQDGAGDELVVAAFLHDLGHMINDQGETPTLRGIDDRHEYVALPFLRNLFGPAVLQPIRLHVDAKRYLCARGDGSVTGAEYWAALSIDSKRSLELQGGIFSDAEANAFRAATVFRRRHAPAPVGRSCKAAGCADPTAVALPRLRRPHRRTLRSAAAGR